MSSKKFTIQYRYLKTDDLGVEANLKALVVAALKGSDKSGQVIGKNARARIIDLDQDGSYVILNKITDPTGWDKKVFAGQLIHLQQGADVAAVLQSLEEDAEEYLLEQVNLGERSNVLKGVLYFVIVDNHVGLLESQQVKGRTLERYLTSMLQSRGDLEPGDTILLNSSFRAADGKQLTKAKDIVISAEPNRGELAEKAPNYRRRSGQGAERRLDGFRCAAYPRMGPAGHRSPKRGSAR